jgi:hypothetical protein
VVPTIASLTPAVGLTAGDALVTIVGTGFRIATPQENTGLGFGEWQETAIVLFGGTPASQVRVFSDTLLTCLAPAALAAGAVAVIVWNLDDDGDPIFGESVALAAAYAYVLPKHTQEFECDFTRTVRTLIQRLKQQLLIDEVNYAVQTDYDPTTGDELHVAKFAKLPGFALIGPDLEENRFYSINQQPTLPDGTVSLIDGVSSAGFIETRVPYTVDVRYQIVCASDNSVEVLNLMANYIAFMHANKWLVVDRAAGDSSRGQLRIEMDFAPGGLPKNTTVPNTSNVRSWSATFLLRGLDIESFAGLAADGTADPAGLVPAHAVVEHGQTAEKSW